MWVKAREVFCHHHGIAKRSVLPPLRHVDGGKAGGGKAAGAAIALFVDLELAFAGAKLGGAAPVQRLVLELDGAVVGVDRLGETENLFGLAGDVGMQAFAGLDPIPAAADHGLAVVGADRGHDLVRRVVAPGQPGGGRRLHRVDHGGEEIRRLHDVGRQPAAFQERRQRCLRFRPVDAIDRRGVISGDHQQPLDAGEPAPARRHIRCLRRDRPPDCRRRSPSA